MSAALKKRQEASVLADRIEAKIKDGDLTGVDEMTAEVKSLMDAAAAIEAAEAQVKAFRGELLGTNTTNNVPVTALEAKAYDPDDVGASRNANYRPQSWVKGLGPAMQPVWVREKMGQNLKDEAQFYTDTFAKWFRDRSKDAAKFWGTATPNEIKAMQENTDNEGGYFVPEDFRAQVIHNAGTPGSVHRPHCTVLTTGLRDGYLPSIGSVTWAAIAEEASYGDNTPTVRQVSFTTRKSGGTVKVSSELLEDSAVNLPALLNQIFDEARGRYEDQQIIEGDGATEHEGLRQSATDGPDSAANNALAIGDIHGWYYALPAQFRTNARVSTTSSFMAKVAALDTTTNKGNLRDDPESRLLGKDVVLFDGTGWDDSASVGADEELGAIGDFRNYYLIDRLGMSLTRDDSVYRANDQVGFFARARGDGRIALADAFRIFKIKT